MPVLYIYLILKLYTIDRAIADDADKKREKPSKKHTGHLYHTVHETHILKIMSFISLHVNHPGSVIISQSRLAVVIAQLISFTRLRDRSNTI